MDLTKFRASLRVLEREIERQLLSESGCCGVSLMQCHILLELSAAGALSLKDLEDRLDTDKAALSRTVDTLVRDGLVVREQDRKDRRYVRIELTKAGGSKVLFIDAACNVFYEELFRKIPERKHATVLESVEILGSVLREMRTSGDAACCIRTGQDGAEKEERT